ncbi:MAG: Bacterial regulatory protein luxR family, partial [Verrucomicrobiota bacterium]
PPEVALNPRQYQVLQLLAKGLSLARVAEQLCLSEHTVVGNDNYSFRIATIRNCRGSRISSGLTWPLARG